MQALEINCQMEKKGRIEMPCYITFLHVSEKVTAKQLLKSTDKVTSLLRTGFQRLKDWCSAL